MDKICRSALLQKPTYPKIKYWQNRYWEHTILSVDDLYKHLDYIHYNPVKHNLVQNVKGREYSSFHKFVKLGIYEENWGTAFDIEKNQRFEF